MNVMKISSVSRIGYNGICEFFDSSGNRIFSTNTKIENDFANTNLLDNNNDFLANIFYRYSKLRARNFIVTLKDGTEYEFLLEGRHILNNDFKFDLKLGLFNKSMKLTINNELVMKAKCKTWVRQWLQSKYVIDILDESRLDLIICSVIIAFAAISDEYICTAFNHL